MGRKSSIHKLPPEVRSTVDRMLREDRYTLNEMIAELQRLFPDVGAPSKSALHRYSGNVAELAGRMRDMEEVAKVLAHELGADIGGKAQQLLSQAVSTTVTHAALRMQGEEDVDIDEVRKLARAAKDASDASRGTLALRRALRDEVEREARTKLEEAGRKGGYDADLVARLIRDAYGL